ENSALRAIHFELFGDEQAARDMWAKVRLPLSETKPDEPLWALLNAWTTFRGRNAESIPKEERIEFVQKQLTTAESMEDKDPLTSRMLFRDIVTLYSGTSGFGELVEQARKHLPAEERR